MLIGRPEEAARVDELISTARGGRSGVLVVRGEAGIGKSALLEHARDGAGDMTVLWGSGVEAESEFPYAALHQVLRPALGTVDRLPATQAAALRAVFALSATAGEGRFRVALAALGLLAELAEERPVLCVADDAQWMDHASTEALLFAARRLVAEPVVMLFAARDAPEHPFAANGLAELRLTGLARTDARVLLTSAISDRPTPAVVDWILDRAEGNPLVLEELPRSLTADQIGGRSSLTGAVPPTTSVEQVYLDRVDQLPSATRDLLLLAAAEETGDRAVVSRAGRELGLGDADLDPAESQGLIRVGLDRIEFRHPLVRAAVYRGANHGRRERAHQALAAALSDPSDADRRAWHRAASTAGPDEEVARDLEGTAARASQRGGYAAASTALERAAGLSESDSERGRRLLAAAELAWLAGRVDRARGLLSEANHCVAPDSRVLVTELRGRIEVRCGVFAEAMTMLESAAETLGDDEPATAVRLLADAEEATLYTGDVEAAVRIGALAAQLGDRCPAGAEKSTAATLEGIGHLYAGRFDAAAPLLRSALTLGATSIDLDQTLLSARVASATGEDAMALDLAGRALRIAREDGAVGALPLILERVSFYEIGLGRLATARDHALEGLTLARETGQEDGVILCGLARITAVRGQEDECRGYVAEAMERARLRRSGLMGSLGTWAAGLLEVSVGHLEKAAGVLEPALHPEDEMAHGVIALLMTPDFIEAAARTGERAAAESMLAAFEPWAQMVGQPWALGRVHHCRGFLSEGDEAADHFTAALDLTSASTRPFERARTELALGETLRRHRKRREAREHLRNSLAVFERLEAEPWAGRARNELRATGETVQPAEGSGLSMLTPQELQIVRRVCTGESNRDVAAHMFVSPRTVEYHLYKAYPKLGVSSRIDLIRQFGHEVTMADPQGSS